MVLDKIYKTLAILFSIATLIFTAIYKFNGGKLFGYEVTVEHALATVLMISFISIIIFSFENTIREKINIKKAELKKINTSYIISYKKATINILDIDGKSSSFREEVHFMQKYKDKNHYMSKLKISGSIVKNSVQNYNAWHTISADNQRMETTYVNDELKNKKRLNKGLYYAYSFQMENTFTQDKEDWVLVMDNYTYHYRLMIIFPVERPPKNCKLIRKTKSSGDEFDVSDNGTELIQKQPIISDHCGHKIISVNLFNLDRQSRYQVIWTW